MNEQSIFLAALDIADSGEREVYVNRTCGGDATLSQQVQSLLAAHLRSGDFLNVPALEQLSSDSSVNKSSPAETSAELQNANRDLTLAFLQPSTQPGSLGRLGHYEIREIIGQGGCGIVLRAFDEVLHRTVAVKVMSPELAATSPARKRFLREARAAAAICHENVVGIHAVEEEPIPFLVMEHIAGQTLQRRLDQHGPLSLKEILWIGSQIAHGLQAAHSIGLVHRDIKPSNILLENSRDRIKITDFGLARAADDASITQSGVIAGTPLYMSPEQAHGAALDQRSDLFSLGSVLYVMCSGRPPFRAATTLAVLKRVAEEQPRPIEDIIPEVPQWLSAIISKLLAKKPQERFASALEVAILLEHRLLDLQQQSAVSLSDHPIPHPSDVSCSPFLVPASSSPVVASLPNSRLTATLPPPLLAHSRHWVTAAAVLLTLLGGLGLTEAAGLTNVRGTVIRLLSSDGTLVVEVDDPGVSVKIEGEEIVITGTGAKEIRLKPGQYKVLASRDGKLVQQELVTVVRNGRQVLRVSKEPAPLMPATADRASTEYVLALGGRVTIRQNSQERPIKSVEELPQQAFELTVADLSQNPKVSDAGLAVFKGCNRLTLLYLNYTPVTDAGLAHFEDCKSLTLLFLQHSQVTDAGMSRFKDFKNLKNLHLDGTRITDAGLAHFKDCESLAYLGLDRTAIGDAGLAHLQDRVGLISVGLNGTQVTDAGLAYLRKCQSLTHLHLNDTQISDGGLVHLEPLKALTHIDLKNTKVTAEGLKNLAGALPQCKIVGD